MIAIIQRWVTPPTFPKDEVKTNATRTLYIILLIALTLSIGSNFIFLIQENTSIVNFIINNFSTLLITTLLIMIRRGNVYTVGRIYLSYIWLMAVLFSITTRGILSPYPALHIIVILLAAIVLNPNYSIGFAVASILNSVFLLYITDQTPLVNPIVNETDYYSFAITNWVIYVFVFTITGVLIFYSSRLINNALERLNLSEERYRMTTELISDYAYAYSISSSGEIEQEWSTDHALEQVTGYTAQEILQPPLFKIFHPEDMERAKQDVQKVINGETFTAQYRILTKDNQLRWIEVTRRPVWDQKKRRVVRYYGGSSDITDRKQAEQHALEVAEVQGSVRFFRDFVSNMTHDLKTPLAIINTSIYLLTKSADPAHQKKHLTKLQNQSNQLTKKINAILTIARLDSIPELTFNVVDVNTMMPRICEEFNSHLEHNTLTLHTNFEDTLPSLLGDVDELHRAITNLVENAINYTPENGSVHLSTHSTQDHIIIKVRDTGIGITPEDLEHIFDRFFRADNAKSYQGTGLGLAILQRIIALHNGTIEVDSTVGEGTTFKLIFPRPQ